MQAAYQEILPATGVDFATTLYLTPSTLGSRKTSKPPQTPIASSSTSKAIINLVTTRNNWLRVYEVREEDVSFSSLASEKNSSKSRRGTEAIAGEIEMDSQGEGFVSVDTFKVLVVFFIYFSIYWSFHLQLNG